MDALAHLAALEPTLDAVPGVVSIWCGPLDGAARYARRPEDAQYAASMMKLAVMVAAHQAHEAGRLDLDAEVPVHNSFASALAGAPRFGLTPREDSDQAVWDRLGGTARLRWLVRRMIVRSSNLATNLVLEHVGLAEADRVWRLVGARTSRLGRGIEDAAAREAGITNDVSAADLARLLAGIGRGARRAEPAARLGGQTACRQMIDTLLAQEHNDDLAAGLPPATPFAHKTGWVRGVRHDAGVVHAGDCPPYLLVVCASTPLATGRTGPADPASHLLARIATASWADRHALAGPH